MKSEELYEAKNWDFLNDDSFEISPLSMFQVIKIEYNQTIDIVKITDDYEKFVKQFL